MFIRNYVFLFISVFCIKQCQPMSVFAEASLVGISISVIKNVYILWATVEHNEDTDRKQQEVVNGIGHLTNMLGELEENMAEISASVVKTLEHSIIFNEKLTDLFKTINSIESNYELFLAIQNDLNRTNQNDLKQNLNLNSKFETYTVIEFVTAITSFSENSVRKQIDHLHELMVPRQTVPLADYRKDILSCIRDYFKNRFSCSKTQSLQQMIYNLFVTLRLIQIKGYIMMQYSYLMLRLHKRGNFSAERQQITEKFNERFLDQTEFMKNVVNTSDNSLWMCDKDGKNDEYTELTRLLQGYIQNENDLSSQHSCAEGCAYYKYVQYQSCTKGTFCVEQGSCNGKLVECRHVDNEMRVCLKERESSRRYSYIQAINKNFILGQMDDNCNAKYKINSWRRYLFLNCYYCLCICDEENSPLSDRFFNLREYLSDVDKNKVIIGAKFVKHNRIIHIHIKQAELRPDGKIDESTGEWVPLHDYTVDSPDVKKGVDYHAMSYEQRAVDLDDLQGGPNQLLTGVRFRLVGAHLNLEIQLTAFSFESGMLDQTRSEWISNDNTDVAERDPRVQYKLPSRKLPVKSGNSIIDVENDSYLQFTYSDEDQDAAQTTVPFIDTQQVEPKPLVPLSGLGISHRGNKWSAGYVMLKLFTYNVAKHLDVQLALAEEAIRS